MTKYHVYKMKKPLKIYLGDLTYDTITLSTEVFPLNVGFVATYCKKLFGDQVDITIFKYIEDLDKAIHTSPPTILGMSCYCWNRNVDIEMFKMLLKKNPHALTVMGGPNFPADAPSQQKFFDEYQEVDVYVPIDGEMGFANIVKHALEANSEEDIKKKVLEKPIDNCVTRGSDGKIQFTIIGERIRDLDEIPSPYLTGLMDKFIDGRLIPIMQTNRGCPFSCTFCTDGSDKVKIINRFSMERVKSEIDYISKRMPKKTHSLYISDLNFGMYPRDLDICNYISETQLKCGFPRKVVTTTGKNNKQNIIKSIKSLSGTMSLLMSVQSMDKGVLKNIKRENISLDQMLALAPAIKEAGLPTSSECILGLPGETFESHLDSLRQLVQAQMNEIIVHACILLDGAEMSIPKEREKWGLKTKFRILPRDFAILSNGKKVLEFEEIIVSTNTLSFDEYLELNLLSLGIFVTNRGVVYDALLKFLREQNVDVFDLFLQTCNRLDIASQRIQDIFQSFKKQKIDELWDSPEELIANYQNDGEYQKLLSEEAGINNMHYHHALINSDYMKEWTDYTTAIAFDLLKQKTSINEELESQFCDISNFCYGLCHNILGKDRMLTNPEYTFHYDIPKWLNDNTNPPLSKFKFSTPTKISFRFTMDQFTVVQDNLDLFGESPSGKGQVLKRVPKQMLYRVPVVEGQRDLKDYELIHKASIKKEEIHEFDM